MPSQLRFPLSPFTWLLLTSLLLVLSAGRSAQAQGPSWQTALSIPQSANAFTHILQTAADGNGNVYVAGTFSESITLGTTTLTARFPQLFVAKWSSTTGQFVWGITQGDALSPNGLAVQGTSVYVSASTTTPTGYVIKVTDAGVSASVGWVQTFPNTSMGELAAVGPSVYLYGSFLNPTLTLGTTTLTNTGFSSLFVAKLTDAGATASYTWAVKAGGSGSASSASAHRLAVQGWRST